MSRLNSLVLVGVVGLAMVATVAADPAAQGVQWQPNLKTARQISIASNKPILVVFGAEWCTYCHKLERNVINQPEMAAFINENFVAVHLDADQHKRVAELLEVDSLPCSIVLSPNADVLGRFKGYIDAKKYETNLSQAQRAYRELKTASSGQTTTR